MRYFFLHVKSGLVRNIHNGRSIWEDHADKAEFIVVKEVGPAMECWEEAMNQPSESILDEVRSHLSARGYSSIVIDKLIKKVQE